MKLYVALGDRIDAAFAETLRERHPDIAVDDLTADDATTDDVLRLQLPRVRATSDPGIVTIAAGGCDLSKRMDDRRPPVLLVEGVVDRLTRIVEETRRVLPNATIHLAAIGEIPDAAKWVERVNEGIRTLASREGVQLL